MSEPRPYHRMFALSWQDFFEGTAIEVEAETDLSLKQQFLDLVLIRTGPGPLPRRPPDGFDDLGDYTLITFKSYQEALDLGALWELVAHFVNYRKQVSPSLDQLLPASAFRLFAVCARYPRDLAREVPLTKRGEGVYEVQGLGLTIRIIVTSHLPQQEHNAMLHLFSARPDLFHYGQEHFRPRSKEISTLLYQLIKAYSEDPTMSEALKEFYRQTIDQLLASLSPEERLKGLSAEERLEGLSAEERLEGLSPEELRVAVEEAQRRLQGNGPSAKPQ